MSDPITRLRAANPVPNCPQRSVEELWRRVEGDREFTPPGRRDGAPPLRSRMPWLPSIGGVLVTVSATVAVCVTVLAIVVLARGRSSAPPSATTPAATSTSSPATAGLPFGSAIRGPMAVSTTGPGAPVPSTVRLVVQAHDPAGGPAWGMRAFETTRGQTCVQAGRVQRGTIGAIGQDGAFGNDHQFHPIAPNVLVGEYCSETDGDGHAFENVAEASLSASGATTIPELDGHGCGVSGTRGHQCRRSDLRVVQYGLLGPDAVSITYRGANGRPLTRPTTGPDGAYLIVEHATARLCRTMWRSSGCGRTAPGGYTWGPTLQSGVVTSVRYRSGHVCRVPAPPPSSSPAGTPQGSCPVVGYVAPAVGHLSAGRLAAPVTARKVPAKPIVDLRFTAHVAVTTDNSYYQYTIDPGSVACSDQTGDTTAGGDIRAGQRVILQDHIKPQCTGILSGTVSYVPNVGPGGSDYPASPGLASPSHSIIVGHFTLAIP